MFRFRRPKNEEAYKELLRSNSLQLSKRFSLAKEDPSIAFVDDTNIQIIISPDIISSPSHEQTPVESTADAASQYNEIKKGSLKPALVEYARCDKWKRAQFIIDNFPDMVRIPLTVSGNTALHVAVRENSSNFVQKLVKLMTPKDLEMQNTDGSTAFCMAAAAGNGNILQIMIKKNEILALIPGRDGRLPVHWAALRGFHKIVQDLTANYLLVRMDYKDIERLFFMTISSSMYDVATKLFEKHPADLAIARDDKERLTALHLLARKHSEKISSSGRSHLSQMLQKLWSQLSQLEYHELLPLISKPSVVLFDAVKSGNVETLKWILYMNRELQRIKDSNGRNLLHNAVFYRQRSIFNFLLKMKSDHLIGAEDKYGNNVLHLAANRPIDASPSLILDYKKELTWFKEVEKSVPRELQERKNSDGKTPEDIFLANYEKISQEVKNSAKTIAKSGMVVATLLVNVAFAAALTVPRDKNNAGFIVFILSNAVALLTSSASIISFMSTLGSRFTEDEFIVFLLPCVNLGRWLLFFSILAMVIAFAAASFFIFDHRSKWVAIVVTSFGLLPTILMLVVFKIPLFGGLFDYMFRPRYYDRSKKVQ